MKVFFLVSPPCLQVLAGQSHAISMPSLRIFNVDKYVYNYSRMEMATKCLHLYIILACLVYPTLIMALVHQLQAL